MSASRKPPKPGDEAGVRHMTDAARRAVELSRGKEVGVGSLLTRGCVETPVVHELADDLFW